MNWISLYQASTFLAIALLAIVVTIFVFASSLLGRAIESAEKEEEKERQEQLIKIAEKVREARKAVNKAIKGTGAFKAARKSLDALEKQKSNLEEETKRIRKRYEVFTRQGGVLHPGCCFLLSAILSGTAWAIEQGNWYWIGFILWGLSLVAMGYGLYRIYYGLGSIESVAKTSEEAAMKRTMEAFRAALKMHEAEKSNRLALIFRQRLPLHLKKKSKEQIKFGITLAQGDIAHSVEVWFFAPDNFGFPGQHIWHQDPDYSIPNAITCKITATNVLQGIDYSNNFEIETPDKADTFTLAYKLYCEGFKGTLQKFAVVVE